MNYKLKTRYGFLLLKIRRMQSVEIILLAGRLYSRAVVCIPLVPGCYVHIKSTRIIVISVMCGTGIVSCAE
jgi:hypothetical protein